MFSIFSKKNGFTLIEMLVVVAIFLITTGVVLSNFKGFNRRSSLDLLAREMSLVIRQAQVYGTATRKYGNMDFPSYGVYFDPAVTNNFILFADKRDPVTGEGNNKYESDELVEQFNLYGGAVIESVQGCNPDCVQIPDGEKLNIVFPRPKPGAEFYKQSDGAALSYSYARITIKDAAIIDPNVSSTRSIDIWRTGHIYVESELGN